MARAVVIRALDAGWILKTPDGKKFLEKLSESENMNFFAIEAIRVIIKYLWSLYKGRIVRRLFFPFLVNFIIYFFFAVYMYDYR